MLYGICNLSVIPGRKEPSDRSELLTHILFGEHFEIIETIPKWVKIRWAPIQYECWIDEKQFTSIDEDTFTKLNASPLLLTDEFIMPVTRKEDGETIILVQGSSLPFFDGYQCKLGKEQYVFNGKVVSPKGQVERAKIIQYAFSYMNAPYTWGGRSPFGMDCSGLTQIAYKMNGMYIPRDACQQAEAGQLVPYIKDVLPGDLAFFKNEEGKVVHVGIVLEESKIIHASGKVRVDFWDEKGIFKKEINAYSHSFCKIKRFI